MDILADTIASALFGGGTPDVGGPAVQINGEAWSGGGDRVQIAPQTGTVVDGVAGQVGAGALVHVINGGLKLPDGLAPDAGSGVSTTDIDAASTKENR